MPVAAAACGGEDEERRAAACWERDHELISSASLWLKCLRFSGVSMPPPPDPPADPTGPEVMGDRESTLVALEGPFVAVDGAGGGGGGDPGRAAVGAVEVSIGGGGVSQAEAPSVYYSRW